MSITFDYVLGKEFYDRLLAVHLKLGPQPLDQKMIVYTSALVRTSLHPRYQEVNNELEMMIQLGGNQLFIRKNPYNVTETLKVHFDAFDSLFLREVASRGNVSLDQVCQNMCNSGAAYIYRLAISQLEREVQLARRVAHMANEASTF